MTYCQECDLVFPCYELFLYRKHCKIEHGWFCCELKKEREGCDFASTTKSELKEHMLVCAYLHTILSS